MAAARVGFIASVTKPFCLNCNRLRLTSDGKLRYCLFAIDETDIKPLLRQEPPMKRSPPRSCQTTRDKWLGHQINTDAVRSSAPPDVFYRRLALARGRCLLLSTVPRQN